jgi:hypothetical protein
MNGGAARGGPQGHRTKTPAGGRLQSNTNSLIQKPPVVGGRLVSHRATGKNNLNLLVLLDNFSRHRGGLAVPFPGHDLNRMNPIR